MSATEELRRMLDERGVEWMPSVFDPQHETFYSIENGVGFIVTEFPEIGRMSLACDMRITPEQAIEATIGKTTTRHGKHKTRWGREVPLCELCGYAIGDSRYHYCPNCGAKVVDE